VSVDQAEVCWPSVHLAKFEIVERCKYCTVGLVAEWLWVHFLPIPLQVSLSSNLTDCALRPARPIPVSSSLCSVSYV